jgi:hypothetical protein
MKDSVEGILMSYAMKFYRDGEGNPRSESGEPTPLISGFLTEDVQDSFNTCREILRIIERIIDGEIGSWRWVGNAHVLSLSADEAKVELLVVPAEEPCRLRLEEFRKIIENWLQFLEKE